LGTPIPYVRVIWFDLVGLRNQALEAEFLEPSRNPGIGIIGTPTNVRASSWK
jgi:hypothetical protein